MEQRGSAENIAGAAMKPRRSCNGASSDAPVLCWSFAGVALKLHWSQRCCIGAPPGLQWSFAGDVDAALELRRGLQWSFAGSVGALVLRWSMEVVRWRYKSGRGLSSWICSKRRKTGCEPMDQPARVP